MFNNWSTLYILITQLQHWMADVQKKARFPDVTTWFNSIPPLYAATIHISIIKTFFHRHLVTSEEHENELKQGNQTIKDRINTSSKSAAEMPVEDSQY